MTLRILKAKPRTRAWRAIHYAAERHEPFVYEGFLRAIRAAQAAFQHDEVAAALERNAPEIAVAAMPWPEFERALEANLMLPLKNAVADGAAAAVRDLTPSITKRKDPKKKPKPRPTNFQVGADISFTLDNPRTANYLARNAAKLVTRIRNETMLAIRRITTDAHARGMNVGEQADKIARALRRDIGLNQRQAGALGRYEAGLVERGLSQRQIEQQVAAYRDRLIDQRARVIARHETLTGSNVGQQEVWNQATEQGLLEPDQKRKWVTQPGLNSDNPCAICRPMNGQIRGLNEEFVSPYDGSRSVQPPIHISCVLGDTLVSPRGRTLAVSKRWVDGEVVVIQCADALPLTCTPNHPVLTRHGWVAAGLLNVGDEVAHPGVGHGVGLGDGQDVDAPARAEDIAEAFFARRSVVSREVPVSAPDFHGDGANSHVAIVGTDCPLWDRAESMCPECGSELDFFGGSVGGALLAGAGVEESFGDRRLPAERGGVWGYEVGHPLLVGAPAPDDVLGASVAAGFDAHVKQAGANDGAGDAQPVGHLLFRQSFDNVQPADFVHRHGAPALVADSLAAVQADSGIAEQPIDRPLGASVPLLNFGHSGLTGLVEPYDLVFGELLSVVRHRFVGWVYNFQTDLSYYIANGYATHNCECVAVILFED